MKINSLILTLGLLVSFIAQAQLNPVVREKVVSSTYNLQNTDGLVLADATGSGFNLNLAFASSAKHMVFKVKKTDSSSNVVVLTAQSGEFIDGKASISLNYLGDYVEVFSTGTAWNVLSKSLKDPYQHENLSLTAACATPSCVVANQTPTTLWTVSRSTTGTYSVAIPASYCSQNPYVQIQLNSACTSSNVTGRGLTSISFSTFNLAGSAADCAFDLDIRCKR